MSGVGPAHPDGVIVVPFYRQISADLTLTLVAALAAYNDINRHCITPCVSRFFPKAPYS